MNEANQQQIDYWNGDAGSQWVRAQEHLDEMLAPLSQQALSRASVNSSDRVLDVGCGCGATSLRLAERGRWVTGVDISGPMVRHARGRAQEAENLEFVQADASLWRGAEPYDIAFSRFGVMFFADPVAAFANIRANLRDSGRLCFICWRLPRDNPWLAVPGAATQPYLSPPPASAGPDPFAFADQDFVSGMLTDAGFQAPEFSLCEATLTLGSDMASAISFLTRIGPLSRIMSELEEPVRGQALAAAETALLPFLSGQGVQLGASCWIVTAKA
jgi:SAM-dependent methyltransferase